MSGFLTALPALAQRPAAGTATVSLTGEGLKVSGEYPTTLCGGPYLLGKGMSYQTRAGEWRITVASETRASGKVALNASDGGVNVVVTANGPGKSFVRGPRNTGTLEVSPDFRSAKGAFELRNVVGKDTANLTIAIACAASAP